MKQESLKLLQRIYFAAKTDYQDTAIMEDIETIIRIETIAKESKFNFYDYTVKKTDPNYNQFGGIYYQDGFKIATNLQVLIAEVTEYEPDQEKKAICKNGEILEVSQWSVLHKWDSIIPKKGNKIVKIDADRIKELNQQITACKKADHKDAQHFILVEGKSFQADNFIKFAKFILHTGIEEVQMKHSDGQSLLFVNTDKYKAAVCDRKYMESYRHFKY